MPELASKELSRKLLEGEAKLEQGSFEEAEVTLREALSINNEVIFPSAYLTVLCLAALSNFCNLCYNVCHAGLV